MDCKWEVLNNVHSGSLFKDTGEDLSKYHVGAELHHETLQQLFIRSNLEQKKKTKYGKSLHMKSIIGV